jgi:hypothetical protein
MYPGCTAAHPEQHPFCAAHWFVVTTETQDRMLQSIEDSAELDYRRVNNRDARKFQRSATIEVVDEIMHHTGSRRSNPYRAIR